MRIYEFKCHYFAHSPLGKLPYRHIPPCVLIISFSNVLWKVSGYSECRPYHSWKMRPSFSSRAEEEEHCRPRRVNLNKFTTKLVKPATRLTANRSCSTFSGNERRLHGENSYWWEKKLAKLCFGKVVLWASCCCLCFGVKLAGVKGRTAKSPNPEQISPTTLQKVSILTTNFNLNLDLLLKENAFI